MRTKEGSVCPHPKISQPKKALPKGCREKKHYWVSMKPEYDGYPGNTLRNCQNRSNSILLSQANTSHYIHALKITTTSLWVTELGGTVCHMKFTLDLQGNLSDHLCQLIGFNQRKTHFYFRTKASVVTWRKVLPKVGFPSLHRNWEKQTLPSLDVNLSWYLHIKERASVTSRKSILGHLTDEKKNQKTFYVFQREKYLEVFCSKHSKKKGREQVFPLIFNKEN